MAVSYSPITPTNMELTPMRVDYKPAGASDFITLGGTLGNVVISFKYMKADIKTDQTGETTVDRRVSGTEVVVTTELTEVKDKTNIWSTIFPAGTLVTSGSDVAFDFYSGVGTGDQATAGVLRLHPLSIAPSGDETYNFLFYKACASSESEITYGPTEQARLKVVWNILPDTSVVPARFVRYGKTTI
jgi:hypothetical protein